MSDRYTVTSEADADGEDNFIVEDTIVANALNAGRKTLEDLAKLNGVWTPDAWDGWDSE